jgi:hypothetical protein
MPSAGHRQHKPSAPFVRMSKQFSVVDSHDSCRARSLEHFTMLAIASICSTQGSSSGSDGS